MADKCRFNFIILFYIKNLTFLKIMTKEGEKVKHEENSQNCPFWTYIFL